MKIVFSRKGHDAENGGGPSPILPDGRLVSLPIPSPTDSRCYGDLRDPRGRRWRYQLGELPAFRGGGRERCHLDPDLSAHTVPRRPGWRPSFGQIGAAGSHLDRQGVGVGDLFLFFGWFRRTEPVGGALRFVRGPGRDLHLLFGWLQVGAIVRPAPGASVLPWLADHPHCAPERRAAPTNRIYLARADLALAGRARRLPGAGTFDFAARRVLTRPGLSRTRWALPRDVFGDVAISYHDARSWRRGYFQSAAKGQEFVLDGTPSVLTWVRGRF